MGYTKGTIIAIKADRIEVRLANGQAVSLPVSSFEGTPAVNQEVAVLAVSIGGEAAGQQKLAQGLLNELLRPSETLNKQEK